MNAADKFSDRAREGVTGLKAKEYGHPALNLGMQDILQLAVLECYEMRIAAGKQPFAPGVLSSIQNIQLKFARMLGGDTITDDTQVDLFGYARTLAMCEELGQPSGEPTTLRARVNRILATGYTAPTALDGRAVDPTAVTQPKP